ncbi:MAG: energy-coupling factor ABC transporter ATP-binding protein [Ruminococcus sp.]|nr:energy-coupling factor ABC transporter ATP-binding protein [Ruminococcus sp.]
MSNTVISFQNVSFRYTNCESSSLSDVTLDIKKGECILLCGASGCGKTTITRLINGLIPHYYEGELSGSVNVCGMDINDTPIEKISEQVGSIFQNPRSQFFCVDTESEIVFGCENMSLPEEDIRQRLERTVKRFALQNLQGRSIFELSGGEKQKIACAGVHCMYPDIIVMDEPTSNLDLDAIAELRHIIAEWKADGKTIVIAEHRLDWLKGLCDRAILLKSGGISLDVTGDELFSRSKAEMNSIGLRSSFGLPDHLDSPCGSFGTDGNESARKVLKLENFRYSYRNKTALDIDSLDIPAGSVTAVVGHNGAGKSTFVKCLCGLQKHFGGSVTIDGKKYRSRQMLKICYMVMQDVNHQLFAESVLEEVMLAMESEDEADALELLRKLDLYELRERHPMSLSGGQKQRTAIASAILAGKRILIFDEPTSGLDYNSMVQTADLIGSLDKDITVLIVTHDMELIERCCTHILHIENGRISEKVL